MADFWLFVPTSRERNSIYVVSDFATVALWGLLSSVVRELTLPENSAKSFVFLILNRGRVDLYSDPFISTLLRAHFVDL